MARQVIILFLTVLVAAVTDCGGAHRYDSRLVQADSLMQANPDSALALVEAVNATSLAGEGDRAYRDLLLTQARYKCYITATSDSDINRALAYYRNHKNDHEKLTRAYIYKGAVMEELGRPDSAMLYYKRAEATTNPKDSANLGYINLKIGQLYQFHNAKNAIVKERMSKAMACFIACRDTNYLIMSMGTFASYMNKIDKDSAKVLLNRAIALARSVHSPHQYFYQSKLAGIYFYQQDYNQAKTLAMDIIDNGRDLCYENMFYYYAARSFIKLGQLDSAQWVTSIIPKPVLTQDSMNHFILQAELAEANHDMVSFNQFNASAERIHRRIIESSSNSTLLLKELECDATMQQTQLRDVYNTRIILIIVIVLVVLAAIIAVTRKNITSKNRRFQQELNAAQQEIRRMVDESEKQISELLAERKKDRAQLKQINREKHQLEKHHYSINRQAARIVKYRNAALNELYLGIKIKKSSESEKASPLSLMETLKDLYEKNRILKMNPSKSFWDNLRLSVEGEYPGIVTFVEKNYPNLSIRDLQLFLLMCASFPNQIISICMNYTGEGTASKRKTNLLRDKMGLDIKIDQFIDMYINGQLGKK